MSRSYAGASSNNGEEGHSYSSTRPSDVSRAFRSDQRYSGDSTDQLRQKLNILMRAIKITNMDPDSKDTMKAVFFTYFLAGPALDYYMDFFEERERDMEDAVRLLEACFVNKQASRLNDDLWSQISFTSIKEKLHS